MSIDRLMVPGLYHNWGWASDDGKFFAHIDEHGGWPLGYRYVGFSHSDGREAGFTNSPHNDGWWTVVAEADDYYVWKLSPGALQRIADAARDVIRGNIPKVDAGVLRVMNSRGYLTEPKKKKS